MNTLFLLITAAWLPATEPTITSAESSYVTPSDDGFAYGDGSAAPITTNGQSYYAPPSGPRPPSGDGLGFWGHVKGFFHLNCGHAGCACGGIESWAPGPEIIPEGSESSPAIMGGEVDPSMPTTVEPPIR